jgi:hypothetical protein
VPMIEYGSKKVLFIHIPKTGGSSIEKWFGSVARLRLKSPAIPSFMKCTPQHLRYTDLEELFGDINFDCIFSIVRNPYARVESEYRWRLSMNRNLPTFSEWTVSALQALKHDPWFMDNHYRPQIEFLAAPVRVFRFEDGLDAVFDFVSAEMDIPCPAIIPHEKRSGGIPADLPWTLELVAAVHDAYEGDFRTLEYEQRDRT